VQRLDAEKRGHVGGDADQKAESGQQRENDHINWNFPLRRRIRNGLGLGSGSFLMSTQA
jgi:hypothetical protein